MLKSVLGVRGPAEHLEEVKEHGMLELDNVRKLGTLGTRIGDPELARKAAEEARRINNRWTRLDKVEGVEEIDEGREQTQRAPINRRWDDQEEGDAIPDRPVE